MNIGVMLRAIDERQGIGIYTQNLMDRLLPLDTKNEYVLFYRNPGVPRPLRAYPHVKEVLVAAPNKMLWDQVAIPAAGAAREPRPDLPHEVHRPVLHDAQDGHDHPRRELVRAARPLPQQARPRLHQGRHAALLPQGDFIVSNSDLTTNDFIRILHVPPRENPHRAAGHEREFQVDRRHRRARDAARDSTSCRRSSFCR